MSFSDVVSSPVHPLSPSVSSGEEVCGVAGRALLKASLFVLSERLFLILVYFIDLNLTVLFNYFFLIFFSSASAISATRPGRPSREPF